MAFAVIEGILIAVHGEQNPRQDEWDAYLTLCEEQADDIRSTLVVSAGGGPNSGQRSALNDLFDGKSPAVAVCTDSRATRGIVTAISWFNRSIRAFRRTSVSEALRYLEIDEALVPMVREQVIRLSQEVESPSEGG